MLVSSGGAGMNREQRAYQHRVNQMRERIAWAEQEEWREAMEQIREEEEAQRREQGEPAQPQRVAMWRRREERALDRMGQDEDEAEAAGDPTGGWGVPGADARGNTVVEQYEHLADQRRRLSSPRTYSHSST